ncbi:MAG: SDR family NAD(P)-dependent oxidoreductase [Paracoccaceae bacterium]
MQITFPGKRVLVTGAGRGIGRGIADAFADEGAEVHAVDIASIQSDRLICHQTDVTDSKALIELVARTGPVDMAIHAAGGIVGQTPKVLEDVTDDSWRAIQAVNLDGAFYLARAVAPGMQAKRSGRIIVISSGAGLRVSRTGIHSYGTAKTAQIGLVRQLSAELGPHGITVNAVAPGYMPQTSPDYVPQWESLGPEGQAAVVESIAMRRLGQPRDIANAVMFLASEHADWITGQTLPVMGTP